MPEGDTKPTMPPMAGLNSPATRLSITQQLNSELHQMAREATGVLRKVQVADGRGSWPNIDAFLEKVDGSAEAGEASE